MVEINFAYLRYKKILETIEENLRREEKYIRHFLFGLNCSFIYIYTFQPLLLIVSAMNLINQIYVPMKLRKKSFPVIFLIRKKNLFAESIKI